MTGPLYEPRDTAKVVKDWLKSELAQPFPELDVRLELPRGWTPDGRPVLAVFDDGGPAEYPVSTDSTVRITTWTNGREVKYANRALALLLCRRVPGIARIRPGVRVITDRDRDNDGDLASFTVIATARTVAV